MPTISIAAEKIFQIGNFPITNSLLAAWLTMAVLIIFSLLATRKMRMVPGTLQSIAEMIVGGLYDFFSNINGKLVNKFFPLIASIFLFIIMANWIGLLPGFGTVGFFKQAKHVAVQTETKPAAVQNTSKVKAEIPPVTEEVEVNTAEAVPAETKETEFIPLFRGATADINMTLAISIIAVLAIQYFGFQTLGFKYSTKFFNFKDPISFFVGLLEIMSEISRVISFTFRLFGNIFAGEVLLTVMAFLMPFIVPLPFLMLELFVGFIQALVFSMLTSVFLSVAVSHEH